MNGIGSGDMEYHCNRGCCHLKSMLDDQNKVWVTYNGVRYSGWTDMLRHVRCGVGSASGLRKRALQGMCIHLNMVEASRESSMRRIEAPTKRDPIPKEIWEQFLRLPVRSCNDPA